MPSWIFKSQLEAESFRAGVKGLVCNVYVSPPPPPPCFRLDLKIQLGIAPRSVLPPYKKNIPSLGPCAMFRVSWHAPLIWDVNAKNFKFSALLAFLVLKSQNFKLRCKKHMCCFLLFSKFASKFLELNLLTKYNICFKSIHREE